MRTTGIKPSQIELGNGWKTRSQDIPNTNWIIGSFPTIPEDSLRFMRQSNPETGEKGSGATDIAVKWFIHHPGDPADWGSNKPTSKGRTMSILAGNGEFQLTFTDGDQNFIVVLDTPGDFAIWGSGLVHSWCVLQESTILTIRWQPD